MVWYRHFSQQPRTGDLYPRRRIGMNGGLGSAVFFYYPLAPYYQTGIFLPFAARDPQGWYQLGLSAAAALTSLRSAASFWLCETADSLAAFFAALVYIA